MIKLKNLTGKEYYIQCTTWSNNNQVSFLSSNEVGYNEGVTVKRHTNNKNKRETIADPRAQNDYVKYFNAIDKNDNETSFYYTTLRKIFYHLIIF